MTASALSARCAELGLPLDRNVIAKLENGHRQSVTVDEMLVLARALEVAPADLLFSPAERETVEILPGQDVPVEDGAAWFRTGATAPTVAVLRRKVAELSQVLNQEPCEPMSRLGTP